MFVKYTATQMYEDINNTFTVIDRFDSISTRKDNTGDTVDVLCNHNVIRSYKEVKHKEGYTSEILSKFLLDKFGVKVNTAQEIFDLDYVLKQFEEKYIETKGEKNA